MLADHPIPTLIALALVWLLLRRPKTWGWAAKLPWKGFKRLVFGKK